MKIQTYSYVPSDADFSDEIPPLLQRIYLARGICSDEQVEYKLGRLPRPDSFKGLDAAIALLETALREQQRVLIVGDFDADGATSAALGVLSLGGMGLQQVDYLVPNRFEYGYGLTPEIVELAAEREPQLIITVDNGISSVDGVAAAKARDIQVLITDHHLPGRQLPEADAIVNPNQQGCGFPSKNLAGVGVLFYLMSALRSRLRQSGWFTEQQLAEPNLASWLDLVALGTVADVVPLDTVNRVLVHQGVQRIRAGYSRPGIRALLDVAGKSAASLVATDLGFVLGPRLNAAGRLDDISIGIQCLLTEDSYLAREYAVQLDELNRDRKSIETDMLREAEQLIQQRQLGDIETLPWGLCLHDPGWHQGVVGLVASRVKDKVYRPVIAFAEAAPGELKGSARSISGLHIRDTLDAVAVANPGLISKFGGHAMAAGLSLEMQNFAAFSQAFDDEVRRRLSVADLRAEIWTDGELTETEINLQTATLLRDGGPWGQQFPEPQFCGTFYLVDQRIVGEKHLKLLLATDAARQNTVDAIAFNVDLSAWPNSGAAQLRAVYRMDINEWRGRQSAQLILSYLQAIE